MADRLKISRRGLVSGMMLANLPRMAHSQTPPASPEAPDAGFSWPEPVELSDTLAILDWRLFPLENGMNFIAEIHNQSDQIVVAPTVGVEIPELTADGNFGWGSPYTKVIYPGESSFIFGAAPDALESDEDWGTPQWLICGEPENPEKSLEAVTRAEYEFETSWVVHQPDWLECRNLFTNKSDKLLRNLFLPGIVREANGRICGATPVPSVSRIEPGETVELISNVRPSYEMLANPFHLVSDLTGASASFSLQEAGTVTNQACPAVMPWNR